MREVQGFELCFVSGGGPLCGPQGSWVSEYIPDVVFGRDFGPACGRHDFLYKEGVMPRSEADTLFRNEMLAAAAGNPLAVAAGYVYYGFVAAFGGLFYGPENASKTPNESQATQVASDLADQAQAGGLADDIGGWLDSFGIADIFMDRVAHDIGYGGGGPGDGPIWWELMSPPPIEQVAGDALDTVAFQGGARGLAIA